MENITEITKQAQANEILHVKQECAGACKRIVTILANCSNATEMQEVLERAGYVYREYQATTVNGLAVRTFAMYIRSSIPLERVTEIDVITGVVTTHNTTLKRVVACDILPRDTLALLQSIN